MECAPWFCSWAHLYVNQCLVYVKSALKPQKMKCSSHQFATLNETPSYYITMTKVKQFFRAQKEKNDSWLFLSLNIWICFEILANEDVFIVSSGPTWYIYIKTLKKQNKHLIYIRVYQYIYLTLSYMSDFTDQNKSPLRGGNSNFWIFSFFIGASETKSSRIFRYGLFKWKNE